MPLRPCLGCGRITRGSRCSACRLPCPARPGPRERRPDYTYTEEKRRSEAVRVWRTEYGDLCPGWRIPPHPAVDLTADHVTAVGAGGSEDGPLGILCRSCNGRKAANPS